jgi:membrane protein insertase Oxa1/YidC/SpoIIIJ
MKKNFWWLIVVIVFVAGLLFSNMIAQAKENVTEIQWEYKTVKVKYMNEKYIKTKNQTTTRRILKQDLSMLNEHGKDGWELCGVNNINYYFKREIKE